MPLWVAFWSLASSRQLIRRFSPFSTEMKFLEQLNTHIPPIAQIFSLDAMIIAFQSQTITVFYLLESRSCFKSLNKV